MKKLFSLLFLIGAVVFALSVVTFKAFAASQVCNVQNCKGYAGPGGPCYAGPGGNLYAGPGGPLYAGPGGACYAGPGGPCYMGPGRIGNCPEICY